MQVPDSAGVWAWAIVLWCPIHSILASSILLQRYTAIRQAKVWPTTSRRHWMPGHCGRSVQDPGKLATIGRRKAVAEVLGLRFSGIIAWWMWRSIYLSKLPGLQKKVRVAIDWALDLVFSKDLVQLPTIRSPTISETEGPATGPKHEPRVPAD